MKVEITVKVVGPRFPFLTVSERNMVISGDYPAGVDVREAVNGMVFDVVTEARAKMEAVEQAEDITEE